MGILRLLISFAVLFGHYKGVLLGLSVVPFVATWLPYLFAGTMHGAIKINGFFLISGFYTQLMIDEKYQELKPLIGTAKTTLLFYYSRVIRLLPCFYAVMAVAAAFVFIVQMPEQEALLQKHFMANFFFSNDLIFSLTAPLDDDVVISPYYLPAMWALTVEMVFVLLAPLFLFTRKGRWLFFGLSLGLAIARFMHGEVLRTFVPASLIYFSVGSFLYRFYARYLKSKPVYVWQAVLAYVFVAVLMAYICMFGAMVDSFGTMAAYFVFIGVFAAFLPYIAAYTRELHYDRWIGQLAYPIYLVHPVCIEVARKYGALDQPFYILIVPVIFALLWVVWVDQPLNVYREKILKSVKMKALETEATGFAGGK